MDAKREGPDEGLSRVRQAIEWFVENGSDREPNSKTLLRWESWCDDPENLEVYREVADLQLLALSVAPPDLPSREALLADVKGERLGRSGAG
jgi:ferric-dicitrate binding protein FerR (iron transport regulator)